MPRRNKTKSGRSASDKMAVAASTAAAVYLLPAVAQAAIVHVTGSPVTLGLADVGGVATWDIDGNGTVDARLVHEQSGSHSHVFLLNEYGTAVSSTSSFSYPRALFIARSSSSSYALQALRRSNSVGTYSQTVLSSATLFTRTSSGAIQLGYGLDANFAAGDNYFGFALIRFAGGPEVNLGWAILNLDLLNGIASITEWAFEDSSFEPIHVPDTVSVDAPSSLALLALGAGGLAAWRRRKAGAAN
jgi:MYXO-CTERM domain-containing protein